MTYELIERRISKININTGFLLALCLYYAMCQMWVSHWKHFDKICIHAQGSHSSWKNDNSFSSPEKVMEFYNFIKNPGKIGVNLEK